MIPASHTSRGATTYTVQVGDALHVEQRVPDESRFIVLSAEHEAWLLDVLLQRSLARRQRPDRRR